MPASRLSSTPRLAVWLGLALVVIVLDQYSKTLIHGNYQLGVRQGPFRYWHRDGTADRKVSGVYIDGKRVKRLDANGGTYRAVVGAFLRKNGIPKPIVRITGLYQADLDGDGRDDVVMTASNFRTSGDFQISTTVGDYDLVMVRSVRNGKAVERVLYFERFGASAGVNSDGTQHWVLAIGDLDGDGDMEVVTELTAWEAGRTDVYAAATTAASRWRSVANENCGV